MKIELRKEVKLNGDRFYQIYLGPQHIKGFYESDEDLAAHPGGDTEAKRKANVFYEEFISNGNTKPIETVIRSVEINPIPNEYTNK
jgi:hypothetical protein